ncbi:MAG: hypothetical protein KAR40_09080, partial [Candidatus Sabulitectum sp.]|nr:hypothetical protein [Candidatus Sabulitectum sp.]
IDLSGASMKENRIDRILRELSELYELNKKIETYKFVIDSNSMTVRTSETEYKLSSCSESK